MNSGDDPIDHSMQVLGFGPGWLRVGFLTRETLQRLFAAYETGEDPNTEHYRYAVFRDVLAARTALTDAEIEQYVELAAGDPDPQWVARRWRIYFAGRG